MYVYYYPRHHPYLIWIRSQERVHTFKVFLHNFNSFVFANYKNCDITCIFYVFAERDREEIRKNTSIGLLQQGSLNLICVFIKLPIR